MNSLSIAPFATLTRLLPLSALVPLTAICQDGGRITQPYEHGPLNRVRPVLMTMVAIMAGLLPIMWSHGTGSSVMQRIVAPMIGGMRIRSSRLLSRTLTPN